LNQSQTNYFPKGYRLRTGSGKDRALLVRFMHLTYQELFPQQQNFSHLAKTVERYLSAATPLWWVETGLKSSQTAATLWMGTAIDQVRGERYAHIFLIFVCPEHRRQGIGQGLMQIAEDWAKARGDRQIGLQVFISNQPALNLYQRLGYNCQSLSMIKSLSKTND
jgi:ribosomal protein S18 acetylase RimI-like enzyme